MPGPNAGLVLGAGHATDGLAVDWSTPILFVDQFFYGSLVAGATSLPPVADFLYVVLVVVVVSFLAYYTTRLVGSAKFVRGGRRNMEIIESMGVGPQSYIHILRVGEKYLLVGVTRGQVNLLSHLDGEQFKFAPGEKGLAFQSLLGKFLKKDGSPNGGEEN